MKIAGKQYPCRVTMGAMLRYKNMTGADVSTLVDGDTIGALTFLYCCVVSTCKADGVEFSMDMETFADGLEPDDMAEFFSEMEATKKK